MAGVSYILSLLLGGLSLAMMPPAIAGVASRDISGDIFFICGGLVGFVAGALFFSLQGRARALRRDDAVIAVAFAWSVLPVVGAVPIALATHASPVDALFEATSGLTTTGATIFQTVDTLQPSIILWRAELQWLGGLLTLVTFAAILSPLGLGGLSARGLAAIGRGQGGMNKTWSLMRSLTAVYAGGTLACLGALFLAGMPAFDALAIALATVSTGGFMPRDGTLAVYGRPAANAVIVVFMVIGATSIVWHRYLLDGRRNDPAGAVESYWTVGVIAAVAGAHVVATRIGGIFPSFGDALGHAIFTAASIVSTTGYETTQGAVAVLPLTMTMFLLFIGGAALSTAGGVKLYRAGAMVVQSGRELHRLVFPNSVQGPGFWGFRPEDGVVKAVWANISVALMVVVVAALLLALQLPTVEAALLAAVSAFANAGPFYGLAGLGTPPFADFSAFGKAVVIATMLLGRIEVFVLVALVSIAGRTRI